MAGPGWVLLAIVKQMLGVFLAVYALSRVSAAAAVEPVQQFLGAFQTAVPSWLALTLAVVLVPADWSFLVLNVLCALVLMEANMFAFLNSILGFYSNCGIA